MRQAKQRSNDTVAMVATAIPPPDTAIQCVPVTAVYAALGSSPQGLSLATALERAQFYGPNTLSEAKGQSLLVRFLVNFTHLMAVMLWIGGLVALLAGMPQLGIAIWMVNVINGLFSFWQEYKAEQATAALRRLLPSNVRVLRDGQEQLIPAAALVPGDLMLLEAGDHISADARLVQESELRVDQSTLTGESHAVGKTAEAVLNNNLAHAEIPNLVFAGTNVVAGTGRAVVVAIGMSTEFGKIAHLTQGLSETASPLQQELQRATRMISALASGIGLLFFVLAVALAGVDIAASFIFAMGMIVAFVPEGLLPTVTLTLALSVQRMVRRHALIKRLSAVETLGCTSVICTDKTGTLTQNEMTVRHLWMLGHNLSITGVGYAPIGQFVEQDHVLPLPLDGDIELLLRAAGQCNNARLLPPSADTTGWHILGDATEAALLVLARKAELDLEAIERQQPRQREIPFDSRRKRMTTLHSTPQRTLLAMVKGAPNEVVARCSQVRCNGTELPLDEQTRAQMSAANDDYACNGLRVLAIAYRQLPIDDAEAPAEAIECDLTFLGLVALMDPPRPEVAAAVAQCHQAGIRIVMITGDYGLTAESIARRIGIIGAVRPRIISGTELAAMDDAALSNALRDDVIFARVAPEHKLRVVRVLQQMGHIVAVTGDGVNDAPALKQADIGVAMGISGSDVAKEAADMILTDDNFASIVNAIEEGRTVYANIRKFAMYVFNSNMAEAVPFVLLLFSRGAIPLPLTVMQVLAIDLGTDMLPAIGLGSEAPEPGVMNSPPRPRSESLLNAQLLARALLWYGLIESVAALSAYFFLNWQHGWPAVPLASEGTLVYRMATTMTLAGVVAAQIGAVFACRSNRSSIWRIGLFSNRLVLWGIGVELCLLALLIYVPWLQQIFNTAPIGPLDWAFVLAWAPLLLLADEIRKLILRIRAHNQRV